MNASNKAIVTNKTTADGLTIYDLDPQASELWAVAGPAGVDPATLDPDALPDGFRWVDSIEWEDICERQENASQPLIVVFRPHSRPAWVGRYDSENSFVAHWLNGDFANNCNCPAPVDSTDKSFNTAIEAVGEDLYAIDVIRTRQDFLDLQAAGSRLSNWPSTKVRNAVDEAGLAHRELFNVASVLKSHGDRYTGSNVFDVAQEWIDAGFESGDDVNWWCHAGVWDAATAAEFAAAELTPMKVAHIADAMVDASSDPDAEFTNGCPIYAACNGDINPSRFVEFAKSQAESAE